MVVCMLNELNQTVACFDLSRTGVNPLPLVCLIVGIGLTLAIIIKSFYKEENNGKSDTKTRN